MRIEYREQSTEYNYCIKQKKKDCVVVEFTAQSLFYYVVQMKELTQRWFPTAHRVRGG